MALVCCGFLAQNVTNVAQPLAMRWLKINRYRIGKNFYHFLQKEHFMRNFCHILYLSLKMTNLTCRFWIPRSLPKSNSFRKGGLLWSSVKSSSTSKSRLLVMGSSVKLKLSRNACSLLAPRRPKYTWLRSQLGSWLTTRRGPSKGYIIYWVLYSLWLPPFYKGGLSWF
jgi:hypothetical protein